MPIDTFSCPECQTKLRRSPQLLPNVRVQCPKCQFQFAVPPPEEDDRVVPPPLPGAAGPGNPDDGNKPAGEPAGITTRDKRDDPDDRIGTRRRDDHDDRDDDRPRRRFRRDDDDDEDYPRPGARPIGDLKDLSSNYEIDLGAWFSYAKEHWSAILGSAIGFMILQTVIEQVAGFVPFVGGLLSLAITPPLSAGMVVVCLAQLKGKRWSFNDYFGGFKKWGETIALAILTGMAVVAPLIPSLIVLAIAFVVMMNQQGAGGGGGGPPPEPFLIAAPFFLIGLVFAMYFGTRLGFFSQHLLFDRNFGIIESIKGSWKLTKGHTMALIGVSLLFGLIAIGGVLACFVGVLFVAPLISLAQTAGYLLIAGSQPPVSRRDRDEDDDRERRDEDERIRRDEDDYDDRHGKDDY